jgi:hypothetical protein
MNAWVDGSLHPPVFYKFMVRLESMDGKANACSHLAIFTA